MRNAPARGESDIQSALAAAAQLGDEEHVRRLLRDGAVVESRSEGQFTPLMLAAYSGHQAIVDVLLSAGADPNARTSNGTNSLILAIHRGHHESLRRLLKGGADACRGTDEGHRPLDEAIARGDELAVRLLLEAGAPPNVYNSRGRAPLHEAARRGQTGIVNVLLEHQPDLGARSTDDLHWTPREFARQAGHGRVLAALTPTMSGSPAVPAESSSVPTLRARLVNLVQRPLFKLSQLRILNGLSVHVLPARAREFAFDRIGEALALIHDHQPRIIDGMRRRGIAIWVPGWFFTDGSYDPLLRACVISSEFVLFPDRRSVEIAGLIVHEATHARTWSRMYQTNTLYRARSERLSFEAERDFFASLPEATRLAEQADEHSRADPILWSRRSLARLKLRGLRDALRS